MTDLDLLVAAAEKIMGWKRDKDYIAVGNSVHKYLGSLPGAQQWLGWSPLDSVHQAFELAQAVIDRKYGFRLYGPFSQIAGPLGIWKGTMKDPEWCCVVVVPDGKDGVYCHLEPSRAITIACLKAVGVETE